MQEEQQKLLHQHHQRRFQLCSLKKLINRPTTLVLFLFLSYFFGYFSASSSTHSAPITDAPITTATTNTITATPTSLSELDHFLIKSHCADPVPSKLVRQTILDRLFNGESPYNDFPPPRVSGLLRQKRVKGWGSNGAVFEKLIRKVKPKTIIEVGTFLGASAIHMSELTQKLGLHTQILCVDDFRGWPGFRNRFGDIGIVNGDVLLLYQFMQNVVHFNATETLLPIPYSSASTLEKLCEWGLFGDLIEIDAGHDFNSAWSDINRAYKLLSRGGVLFGHDYFTAADNRGVRRAVNLFARVNGLRVQLDGQHWVIESS